MIYKILVIFFIVLNLFATDFKDYREVSPKKAIFLKKGRFKKYCTICGMNLAKFYKTNHAAKHKNHYEQYCSIKCLVEDMVVNGKKFDTFFVVDNVSLKFIPANKAFYVVGSKKIGTMSIISKYAFNSLKSAIKFQKENGGKIMRFKELVEFVKKRNAKEFNFLKKERLKKINEAKKFLKLCKPIKKHFSNSEIAFSYLKENKICPGLLDKQLYNIALFLSR